MHGVSTRTRQSFRSRYMFLACCLDASINSHYELGFKRVYGINGMTFLFQLTRAQHEWISIRLEWVVELTDTASFFPVDNGSLLTQLSTEIRALRQSTILRFVYVIMIIRPFRSLPRIKGLCPSLLPSRRKSSSVHCPD